MTQEKVQKAAKGREWRTVDYVWSVLILILAVCTAEYAFVVFSSLSAQRDVSRYNPKTFGVEQRADLQKKFNAYVWPKLTDAWIPIVSCLCLGLAEAALKNVANDWAHRIQIRNSSPKIQQEKANKVIENLFEGEYYGLAAIIEFYLLQQTDFLPSYMGGKSTNSVDNIFQGYPLIKYPFGFRTFFFISLGIHLLRSIQLIRLKKEDRRNDFLEMVLHHGLTVVAFAGAYFMNISTIGIMVVFLTDVCNFFVHNAKAFAGTEYGNTCNCFAVGMWLSWLYTRLICFPLVFIRTFWVESFKAPGVYGSNQQIVMNILGIFCVIVLVLSIYWFVLITQMIYVSVTTGEQEDTANKIDEEYGSEHSRSSSLKERLIAETADDL